MIKDPGELCAQSVVRQSAAATGPLTGEYSERPINSGSEVDWAAGKCLAAGHMIAVMVMMTCEGWRVDWVN